MEHLREGCSVQIFSTWSIFCCHVPHVAPSWHHQQHCISEVEKRRYEIAAAVAPGWFFLSKLNGSVKHSITVILAYVAGSCQSSTLQHFLPTWGKHLMPKWHSRLITIINQPEEFDHKKGWFKGDDFPIKTNIIYPGHRPLKLWNLPRRKKHHDLQVVRCSICDSTPSKWKNQIQENACNYIAITNENITQRTHEKKHSKNLLRLKHWSLMVAMVNSFDFSWTPL